VLPGLMIDSREEDRSRRDGVVDATMYLIAFALSGVVLADTWTLHPSWLRVVDLVIGVATLTALHWRRSHPAAVGIFTAAASIVMIAATGPALVGAFNAAIRARGLPLAFVAGLSITSCVVIPLLYRGDSVYWVDVGIGLLLTGIVFGWGLFVRARRELMHALRERAERAEVATREAERQRIAREMHDVLAHRISLLSVHAGALEFRPDAPAEEVAEHSPEPPQPTLADVPALVEEWRIAGMRVELELAAAGEPLPAALGRTAYRIVQEGLTNARKHAPGAAVDVALTRTGDSLTVQVRSRPPVGVAAAVLPGAGTGLIGLAERVSLAGGELEHGLDAAGAFFLRARPPYST
jgi:signal transduction histidine kinase